MNHTHSTRFAAPTFPSFAPASSSPPPEAMDFARATEPGGFQVPRLPHGSDPLVDAASPLPAVKPPTPEPQQVVVHEPHPAPAGRPQGTAGSSGLGTASEVPSDMELILMHNAVQDASRGSSSSGWDGCFEFLDRSMDTLLRGSDSLLRECSALYRSAGARCTDLGARADACASRCEQLSQAGHELWAGFGQCCNDGLGLCASILKCPVTTCSSLCESVGQVSCDSAPSCSCDCNCGDCDCGDCGGCD